MARIDVPAASVLTRAEDLPRGRRAGAFLLLMIFEFCYGWSWNTVDVLRPQIRDALGLTLTQAGSMYSAQSFGALIGAIGFGTLADRVGRRRVLIGIVAGTALAAAAGVLVASYPQLLAQRFVLGLFLGANFPVLIGTYMSLFASEWRGKLASIGQGFYSLSIIALGWAYARFAGGGDWRVLLLMGAVPALLLSPLILLLVPDDRRMIAWGAEGEERSASLPLLELFAPELRRTTLLLFALVALNFFSYQAFAGWTTTLLRDERGLSAAAIGALVAWQFAGATAGGLVWGWLSDRFGRRFGGFGFIAAGIAAFVFLEVASGAAQLTAAAVCWGFTVSASVAWAPWMSELYPARLRSSALSIFNWGRIVSMFAPLVTGAVAASYGLTAAMALSAVGFMLAGFVWFTIPETIGTRRVAVHAGGS